MTDILVLVDHDDGVPRKISRQILTAARQRGDGQISAVLLGPGAASSAEQLGAHGVSRVFVWDAPEATRYATEPLTEALVVALHRSQASILLFPSEPFLTDVVARAAIRLQAGVVTDATDLQLDGDRMVATKAIFGGDMVSRCQVRGQRLQAVGVKANAFAAEETGGAPAEVHTLDVELPERARRAEVVEVVEAGSGDRPDLGEAAVIVTGGRGLGDAEGFRLVEQLADALGGAVGASRAATDAGWYPHQHQIGQTGKTVSPQLYLGVGVSGAIQHRAGMQTAQTVAVINKDAEAPLFAIADVGVVGDLHKVVPALVDEIDKRRG